MGTRLDIRPAFRNLEKRPRVYFYTTSTEKYLQARFVFGRSGLPLQQFRSKSDPYQEDEHKGTEALLTAALDEVRETIGDSFLFFVEDTSVVIDALSTETEEVPGLFVKEWFARTSYDDLDQALRAKGVGRAARVRSDIALHVPNLDRPVFFHGETAGTIAESAPHFETNSQHPWLSNDTFSAWFVPDGTTYRLGEMPVEQSISFDFRAKALFQLLDRLEEYTAGVNLPSAGYQRKPRYAQPAHPELFESQRPALMVIGPTCAGKTTFAERADGKHGLTHIEASSIVRTLDKRGKDEPAPDFARRVLTEMGPDVVARRILEWYEEVQDDQGFVISGFRTIEEILTLKERKPDARVVLVEASPRIRLERYLKRPRESGLISLDELEEIDREQGAFGLLSVASQVPDIRIRNEETLEDYYAAVDAVIEGNHPDRVVGVSTGPTRASSVERGQLERCARILQEAGRPLSTDEIEARSVTTGSRIRHNNANKVLKRYPALVDRLEKGSGRLRYQILPAGQAYLRYLDGFVSRASGSDDSSTNPA